jgi:hypothetical protein
VEKSLWKRLWICRKADGDIGGSNGDGGYDDDDDDDDELSLVNF